MTVNGSRHLTFEDNKSESIILGIILDRSLSFNAHVKHIKQSLLSSL